jgi:hypothetical protein
MRRTLLIVIGILALSSTGDAQIIVHDTSVTARNVLTAALNQYLLEVQSAQHSQLRRMAQRLSFFTPLNKYTAGDAPRWRRHPGVDDEGEMMSALLQSALDFGDADGAGYLGVAQPVGLDAGVLSGLPASAQTVVERQLATIDLADAVSVSTINDEGRLRFAGRAELSAIDALEGDVVDGSLEQSATAVLDKISGAELLGARQKQARTSLLVALVEQLAVDTKRERDTYAAALNMQLAQWANSASRDVASSPTGDALRTWRQP